MSGFEEVVGRILAERVRVAPGRSLLVALTGIDGCGKGWIAARIAAALAARGLRPAVVNIDGWLSLPSVRFDPAHPAETFYRNAIRFDALFEEVVLPLRATRSVSVEVDFTEETARSYRRHRHEHEDVDVILLEGIFLLKREHRHHYDLALWIDCSFETALERAVARAQEGLPPAQTVAAYERLYFPAQRIHFRADAPRRAATLIIRNDPRPRARMAGA